ncbi:SMI1/KNR4 family protein [Hymenobacter sp. J193]|uniref:SMI1/KNR4 family protein n=1 Tax=Hymenobacter sp. J193 TaxID=2898429 RepID=UPI0021511983|nr:SMI1/KNR4 family protein [Hymenobacter sp. J193]MCR5889386.1 SMI1/KNR4 family protein [Hymenobacter sp. J193]
MHEELLNRIRLYLAENELFAGQAATPAQLAAAEAQLGVAFAPAYREFVALFGGSYVGVPVYGFNNCPMLSAETVVDLTIRFRNDYQALGRWPVLARSYVISLTGSGDPVILDLQGQVRVYYHDSGEEEVLADSFQELLEQHLPH